jgi:hypothetical protein
MLDNSTASRVLSVVYATKAITKIIYDRVLSVVYATKATTKIIYRIALVDRGVALSGQGRATPTNCSTNWNVVAILFSTYAHAEIATKGNVPKQELKAKIRYCENCHGASAQGKCKTATRYAAVTG